MTSVAAELWLVIGLFLCWILVFVCWMDYRVDLLRQELFALRSELFDYAADGNIEFGSPAYCRLRILTNALIRFAHKLNFPRLVLATVVAAKHAESGGRMFMREWASDLEKVPPEVRERLVTIHQRIVAAYMSHILAGSPILRLASLAAMLGFIKTERSAERRLSEVAEEQALENDDELQPAYA